MSSVVLWIRKTVGGVLAHRTNTRLAHRTIIKVLIGGWKTCSVF